jgi:hypothetical protein
MSTKANFLKGRIPVVVRSRLLRARLLIVALLATSLIKSGYVDSQTKMRENDSVVITTATTEMVHDRLRIELPRIITWRPLPVVTTESHRHGHPPPAPKTTRKSS